VQLFDDTPTSVPAGIYTYHAIVNSGTTLIEGSGDGGATFTPISGLSWTANQMDNLTIGAIQIKATIPDGEFYLTRV